MTTAHEPRVRKRKPRCPRCRHTGFRKSKAGDGRPRFTCDKCNETWTCGKTGGDFTAAAMKEPS